MDAFFPNMVSGNTNAEVVMTVNGIEVPFQAVAEGFWQQSSAHFDKAVLEKADHSRQRVEDSDGPRKDL
jgi:hypothetical protein